jgi:hypothetical protein
MKTIFELHNEIRESDASNRILGENSESHLIQCDRFLRLARLLDKKADELSKSLSTPEPEPPHDTF